MPCNVYRCLDLFNEKDLLEFAADITAKKQSNMRNFMEGFLTSTVELKRNDSTQATYRLFGQRMCHSLFQKVFQHSSMVKSIRHDFISSSSSIPLLLKNEKRGGNCFKEDDLSVGSNWAVQFLLNYGRTYGRPRPDGREYKKASNKSPDNTIYMLNTCVTKRDVYEEYKRVFAQACSDNWFLSINLCMNIDVEASIQPKSMPEEPISYSWFTSVWEKRSPFVVVGAKQTDYCDTCKAFNEAVHTDELEYQHGTHVISARAHRAQYNQNIQNVYSSSDSMQIDLDYAEGVSYPQYRQQPGSLDAYCITPRDSLRPTSNVLIFCYKKECIQLGKVVMQLFRWLTTSLKIQYLGTSDICFCKVITVWVKQKITFLLPI